MLSLVVTSLFTNVPTGETIKYLCKHNQENSFNLGIPLDELKQLLFSCTENIPL